MANTYTQLYVQIVFAVQDRANLIPDTHKEDLHRYLTGIVQNHQCKLIAVNSMPDHVHVLVGLHPALSLSALVREIKLWTSRFINEQSWMRGKFRWQEGYGAFSYSRSQLPNAVKYINNQEEHHRRQSFRQEYVQFLKAFGIAFDDRYLPGWE